MPSEREIETSAEPLPLAVVRGREASADKYVLRTGETLRPAPTVRDVRPTPSVDPDCPAETTVESDPVNAGDQG